MGDQRQAETQAPEEPRINPAAQRALAEAEQRRAAQRAAEAGNETPHTKIKEINGRDGPEPVRYGDWEVKGIASDF